MGEQRILPFGIPIESDVDYPYDHGDDGYLSLPRYGLGI
jgi:hypothetical protein